MGPFFSRFRKDLEAAGAVVHKVNFCAGDRLYYPFGAVDFRGSLDDWPAFLNGLIGQFKIDTVFLFGDCRFYHRVVPQVIRWRRIALYVFEEGYLRPDFITVEPGGANNYSSMSRDPDFYRRQPFQPIARGKPVQVTNAFVWAAVYSIFYALANTVLRWRFPHYQHHRSLSPIREAFFWARSAWRKRLFAYREQRVADWLNGSAAKHYFLVPLQTHNDAQISVHSRFSGIEEFIENVLISFARSVRTSEAGDRSLIAESSPPAPAAGACPTLLSSQQSGPSPYLVFKHHPLDRGYRDYGVFLQRMIRKHGLEGRVVYVHDVHLPTLLSNALGTIVVNSTVGLSSILHGTPVCVLGDPVYHMPGLTFQGALDEFWHAPGQVDKLLFERFRAWLRAQNQANGSFYARLSPLNSRTGVLWPPELGRPSGQEDGVALVSPVRAQKSPKCGYYDLDVARVANAGSDI
ncbi:capsule biosynthesis protein [Thiocystis violacea]|uniref:capsule biosynthesis protein n=1 Tax=Thiocystis violacea TaxID=13725 RepID=UPI001A928A89|nr:capsular biosynthesis protein [Thiocystis violacea]